MQTFPKTWKSQCKRYTVVIDGVCLEKMMYLAGKQYPNEVSTRLIGHYSDDSFTAYIDDLAPGTPDSTASRYTFQRGVTGIKQFFQDLWIKTQGKQYYIGEWHSHPDGPPHPSDTDDRTHLAICRDNRVNRPELVALILGGSCWSSYELAVYIYSRENGKVRLFSH